MLCVVLSLAACNNPPPADGTATVTGVVDGDTIDVRIGGRDERVRLIGVDTPETKKPNSPVECFGPEASEYTASLLPVGTPVRMERDVVGRDDYGRLLGYVHRLDDDLFVNLELLHQGLAVPLTIEPNSTHRAQFVEAARSAQGAGRGLWSACSPP
jgi:micrococcal nuclease